VITKNILNNAVKLQRCFVTSLTSSVPVTARERKELIDLQVSMRAPEVRSGVS
jgi:hypothetical protein